jgi:tetratricopeptide (TPR) repeat protein
MARGWCVVVAAVLWASATVAAQAPTAGMEEEARNLFRAGSSAYSEGRYESALDYFRRSYELSGRSMLLYNMATAADRLRQDEDALRWYRQYLEEVPDAPNASEVKSRAAVIERTLDRRAKAAEESRKGEAEVEPEAGAEQGAEENATAATADAPPPKKSANLKLPGWIMVAAGGAILAGGATTGAMALSLDGKLADRCNPLCEPEDQSDIDRRDTMATLSTVMIIGGAAVAAAGVVLLLLPSASKKERREAAFTPVLGPHVVGGTWRRSF